MRALIAACISIAIGACGPTRHHGGDDDGTDACVGMQCNVVNCAGSASPTPDAAALVTRILYERFTSRPGAALNVTVATPG